LACNKKYNIPLIFLSATSLMENNDYIFVANSDGSDKYYFIKSPGISNLKVPKYRLFVKIKFMKVGMKWV
jgi:hypothetical protein